MSSEHIVTRGDVIFYDHECREYYAQTEKGRVYLLKVKDSPLTLMVPGQIEYVEIKGEVKA